MKKRTIRYLAISTCFTTLVAFSLSKESKYSRIINEHTYHSESLDIIAHRGFSSVAIENSKEAIEKANKNYCTNKIEIDVRMTKDNVIVLSHDEKNISDTNFLEIKKEEYKKNYNTMIGTLMAYDYSIFTKLVKIGTKEGALITLKQAMKIAEKPLLIDVKFNKNENVFISELFKLLEDYDKEFILQSADYNALIKMASVKKDYKYYYIVSNKQDLKRDLSVFDGLTIRKELVTKDVIEKYKDKKILVWTVNTEKELDKLDDVIDDVSIITDYPDCVCPYEKVR